MASNGPDQRGIFGVYFIWGYDYLHSKAAFVWDGLLLYTAGSLYDPTNGTVSWGNIVRIGP